MNIDAMVTTVELPKEPSAVLDSTHPVTTSRTTTSMELKDIGIFLIKNSTIISAKISRQSVI